MVWKSAERTIVSKVLWEKFSQFIQVPHELSELYCVTAIKSPVYPALGSNQALTKLEVGGLGLREALAPGQGRSQNRKPKQRPLASLSEGNIALMPKTTTKNHRYIPLLPSPLAISSSFSSKADRWLSKGYGLPSGSHL